MNTMQSRKISRKQFMKNAGGALLGGALLSAFDLSAVERAVETPFQEPIFAKKGDNWVSTSRVAADPGVIPAPITRDYAKTVHIELEAKEVMGEIEKGTKFHYMTFNGQIPAPMLRVRQGDTIILTLKSNLHNMMLHNIDLHAVYGSGGGADATYVTPGSAQTIKFKAMYPGAFAYHCAVPGMDQHVSSGMFGLILVEPQEGLTKVNREFYIGQNEIYIKGKAGDQGLMEFGVEKMIAENPDYVLFNGEKNALSSHGHGALKAKVGETARLFFVNGGPNLISSIHPIGNVFTKAWRDGALANTPERYVQTMAVPPGNCAVFEMDFPVPSTIHLVDHAMSRMEHKGAMGHIEVEGAPDKSVYDPDYTIK